MYKIYRKNNYLIIDNGIDNPEGYLAKDILVQEIVVDTIYEMYGVLPKLGNTSNQLLHSVSIPNILKEDNSPYTASEWMDFYTVNTGFFFEVTNGSGDTGSIPANQFVANYSALPDPTTIPYQIWICENAEGTQWLPGSLGGTYYPEGGYVSNGTKWIYHKDNYQATQNEVNIGTVTNKWLSPFTFENASKWNTKENILVSGTNIKTINGDTILGSGDLIISGGGSSNLDGLTDVIITTPINGQTLSYDGTNWVNNTLSGGGSVLSFQEVMRLKTILNNA